MMMMWSVVSYLSGSELVAGLQRACGLFPAPRATHERLCPDSTSTHSRANGTSPPCQNGEHAAKGCKSDAWSSQYEVKNWPLYYLFVASATLGNEVFYISFLPFIHWNLDPFLCRRLVNMWAVVMYIGQVMKDMLKLPRPSSPPVVKLEHRIEFGMPSTHAMAATAIAFTLLLSAPERVKFQFEVGLVAAVVLSALVSLSRLYTGMHSALDVICGTLISALVLVASYPHWDSLDFFQLNSPLSPAISLVLPLILCYKYPKLDHYSATRGDTTIILGCSAGCSVGYWLNQRLGVTFEPSGPFPVTLPPLTPMIFTLGVARFCLGLSILVLTRQVMKWIALRLLCWHYGVELNDVSACRRKEIEVPSKFSTYTAIGLVNSVVVCRVFGLVGLL
ncbi:sphingosine-1-phosphate phosphatase 2-like isoform X1 [Ictalurus furcatus]|uniref:sphingosine-1-phosphate phosphatase 2-like isoform X1 n=1 Tax=Ictalurus furcatus TaxID=66913 RepID=UPI00234FF9E9|nr:sphingosine-1-phosphate phosphatase 2-like isoform X1 [Ictalurus furcatus]